MASKRKEKELNDLIAREREKSLAKLASSPDLVNERVNPDSNNYQIDSETKVNASRLIKSQLESNQPSNPNKLLLKDLLSIDVNLVDEIEANNPNVRPDFISDEYLKCSSKLDLKVPSDEQNILNSPQDCLEILEAIKPLARIILSSEFDHEKHFYIGDRLKLYNSSDNNISREKLLLEIKLKTLYLITKTARIANEFLIKPQFSLEEFKQLVKTTTREANLNKVTAIKLTDLSEILKGISQIFPEFELPKKKRVKPRNKAYKLNNNEWTPNSPQSNDILSNIIKPYLWTEESNGLQCLVRHKKKGKDIGYSQLNLFKTDSTGDLVPIEDYSAETILNGFDLRDRKILRLLMIEAVQHKGEPFTISGKWILKLIGDDRSSVSVNGKRLTSLKKLEDLERRLWSYDAIKFHWNYKVGKKEFRNLPDGFPIKATFKIFGITGVSISKDGRGYELTATITPSDWFEFNQKTLQQFTKIPKQLLAIDIYKYPRAYLIGERICELFRFNKQKFAKSGNNYQTPLTITMKSLLDEIIDPSDLEKALIDPKKGYRLKERIIEDTKYLAELLSWQFNWQGVKEGDNFNAFYNSASFSVILDCQLESEILGEKVVETKAKKVKTPLSLDGEQIKALRKKLELTQESFGNVLGYSKSYISKIESGREVVTQEFIKIVFSKYSAQLKNI